MKKNLLPALLLIIVGLKANAQLLVASDSVPVRVSYFNAGQNNNKTLLKWKVVCYLNYANFEVQGSINGTDYTTINTFSADRIRCLSPFDFEDASSSGRTFYRLKVGDKDGGFSTSKVLIAFGKEKSFEINSITPNLVTNVALLSISSADLSKANILITNSEGRTVKQIATVLNKGNTDVKLDLSELSKGLYFIKIRNSASEVRIIKFIKV